MTKVLVVTNDFPPRSGGIQSFVHALATRLPAEAAGRVTFHCYESGHMIGGDEAARPELAQDLRAFIAAQPASATAAPRGR